VAPSHHAEPHLEAAHGTYLSTPATTAAGATMHILHGQKVNPAADTHEMI